MQQSTPPPRHPHPSPDQLVTVYQCCQLAGDANLAKTDLDLVTYASRARRFSVLSSVLQVSVKAI